MEPDDAGEPAEDLALPALAQTVPASARIVSMNLCTDQLALMIADPGAIVSLSNLSHDRRSVTPQAVRPAHVLQRQAIGRPIAVRSGRLARRFRRPRPTASRTPRPDGSAKARAAGPRGRRR